MSFIVLHLGVKWGIGNTLYQLVCPACEMDNWKIKWGLDFLFGYRRKKSLSKIDLQNVKIQDGWCSKCENGSPLLFGQNALVFILLKRIVSPNDWGGPWGQSYRWPPAGSAIMSAVVDKIAPSARHIIITQHHFGQTKKTHTAEFKLTCKYCAKCFNVYMQSLFISSSAKH